VEMLECAGCNGTEDRMLNEVEEAVLYTRLYCTEANLVKQNQVLDHTCHSLRGGVTFGSTDLVHDTGSRSCLECQLYEATMSALHNV
jgi:hypothetical protein